MTVALGIYLTGVAIGLAVMRDRWPERVITALAWPLGPAAFVVVITIMLLAAAVLWPVPVLSGAALITALGWMLLR